MSEALVLTLKALRDVQGIEGSFIINTSGGLLAKEMPAIFSDTVMEDASPRIARLGETFQSAGVDFETCSVRFAEHFLYIRKLVKGFLCVLTQGNVNLPALKMAVNLAQRRLISDMETAAPAFNFKPAAASGSASTQPVALAAQSSPEAATTQQPARKRVRMYRGQLIED